MSLKFYVATRFSNKADVNRASRLLKQTLNHEITYNWAGILPRPVTTELLQEAAIAEIDGVINADYMV